MTTPQFRQPAPCGPTRRAFLADTGMGFTGLALATLLFRDGVTRGASPSPQAAKAEGPHFPAKAKHVIWLYMVGGVSHLESFDPKPALNKYAGKSFAETPYEHVLKIDYKSLRLTDSTMGHLRNRRLCPLQVGYRKRGRSGIEISDWWPCVGECIDDIALVRSMWTSDNNHSSQLESHTGRHFLDGAFPTIGSWVHYGLGSLNDNLPAFVVLGHPLPESQGGSASYGADYLGPTHAGVRLAVDPKNPLPFASPAKGVSRQEQQANAQLLGRLGALTAAEYPEDEALRARVKSYELAFRMQAAVPETFRLTDEPEPVRRLYGLDQPTSRPFGELCLAARRLVERGVRFVQVFHGSGVATNGAWDSHFNLRTDHARLCAEVDRPIAGLLKDLKRRGLLDETIVVWGSEFGRSPGLQATTGNGRDHHPFGFSAWMAGGGLKGGAAHGATDELGFHAVEQRHYVTDIHATILRQLGLDSRRLEVPGRKRLDIEHGKPITEIIA